MPRPPKAIKSVSLHVHIAKHLKDKVEAFLYSDAKRCIPHGEYQRFFEQLIEGFFSRVGEMQQTSSPYIGSYARLICPAHGKVTIDTEIFNEQAKDGKLGWHCPKCDGPAEWDEGFFTRQTGG